jgi:hypothetical protein
MRNLVPGLPSRGQAYVLVDDVAAATAKATSPGAETVDCQ